MVLEDTTVVVGEPLLKIFNAFVEAVPGIIAAILILILGYLIGSFVAHLFKKLLDKTHLVELLIKKVGLQAEIGTWDITGLLALFVKWSIFVVFLNPAADVVRLDTLAEFFLDIALWIPNIIVAIVIMLGGLVLAEYIAKKIRQTRAKKESLLAGLAKVIVIVYAALISLRQLGIKVSFAENSFLIILAGIAFGLALAFGLGLKDEAKDLVKGIRKRL